MDRHWKLFRVALWLAIAAFVGAGLAGLLEERFDWSDDPRWNAYICGLALTFSPRAATVAAAALGTTFELATGWR